MSAFRTGLELGWLTSQVPVTCFKVSVSSTRWRWCWKPGVCVARSARQGTAAGLFSGLAAISLFLSFFLSFFFLFPTISFRNCGSLHTGKFTANRVRRLYTILRSNDNSRSYCTRERERETETETERIKHTHAVSRDVARPKLFFRQIFFKPGRGRRLSGNKEQYTYQSFFFPSFFSLSFFLSITLWVDEIPVYPECATSLRSQYSTVQTHVKN